MQNIVLLPPISPPSALAPLVTTQLSLELIIELMTFTRLPYAYADSVVSERFVTRTRVASQRSRLRPEPQTPYCNQGRAVALAPEMVLIVGKESVGGCSGNFRYSFQLTSRSWVIGKTRTRSGSVKENRSAEKPPSVLMRLGPSERVNFSVDRRYCTAPASWLGSMVARHNGVEPCSQLSASFDVNCQTAREVLYKIGRARLFSPSPTP